MRRVISGSYPLYRLIMLATLISAILQLITGRFPESISSQGGAMVDILYVSSTLAGSTLILGSFWVRQAWTSLQVERLGCIGMATAIATYLAAVIASSGMPVAGATWGAAALCAYCAWRALWEIPRDLREVRRVAREAVAGE